MKRLNDESVANFQHYSKQTQKKTNKTKRIRTFAILNNNNVKIYASANFRIVLNAEKRERERVCV